MHFPNSARSWRTAFREKGPQFGHTYCNLIRVTDNWNESEFFAQAIGAFVGPARGEFTPFGRLIVEELKHDEQAESARS